MTFRSPKNLFDAADLYLILAFFFLFTLLTPLGQYKPSLPKEIHAGYYSVTEIDWGDDAGYYSYLRSFFFDGDFDFFNEKKYAQFENILPTGYSSNYWTIGPALFWTPFFLLGHLLAHGLSLAGMAVSLDGYSFPYYIATAMGSTLFSFGGVFFLSILLSAFFEKRAAYTASIVIFAATALPYFTFIRQRMAHALEFLLVVLFLYVWIKAREKIYDFPWMALWGICMGALALTRLNDLTFLIIPGLDFCAQAYFARRNNNALLKLLLSYGIFLIALILTIIPIFIIWNLLGGSPQPLVFADYHSHFFSVDLISLSKKIFVFFTSNAWGIFWSEPVWILALPGLLIFIKKEPFVGFVLCVAAFFPIYISANTGGGPTEVSFGHRFALAVNPVLSFGLASLLSRFFLFPYRYKFLVVLCGVFALLKYIQFIQYKILLPYNDPNFSIHSIKNIPFLLENPMLWIRASCLWKILLNVNQVELIDGIFLFLFPLSVLAGMLFLVVFYHKASLFFTTQNGLTAVALFLIGTYLVIFSAYKPKTEKEIANRYFEGAGVQLLLRKDIPKAVFYLKKALELDKDNILILNALGDLHANYLGDSESAIAYLEKSLSISPNQGNARSINIALATLKNNGPTQ